jgi:hypothetical protein
VTAPAAFTGTFSDIRSVKTRSLCQIIIEVPIEQAASIIAMFGYPTPGEEIHVAVARLKGGDANTNRPDTTMADNGSDKSPPPSDAASGGGESRKWDDLPYSQQAGIRCAETHFQNFINERFYRGESALTPTGVVNVVRRQCGVASRSQLIRGTPAGDRWHYLDTEFLNWKHAP